MRGDTAVFVTLEDRCLFINPPASSTESHPKSVAFTRAIHETNHTHEIFIRLPIAVTLLW